MKDTMLIYHETTITSSYRARIVVNLPTCAACQTGKWSIIDYAVDNQSTMGRENHLLHIATFYQIDAERLA